MVTAAMLAGRYRLIEPVGRGGMAEVWRGEDVRLGRQVAIKLIFQVRGDSMRHEMHQDATAPSGGAAEEVLREARDAARLVHPNVVGVYDVGVDDGRLFIVMEWVAGRDLATVLHRHGPLPAVQVAWIGVQTARALAAAHAAGIVHRDVKPANLMLTRAGAGSAKMSGGDGMVKLADFGIAVRAEPGAGPGNGTGPGGGPADIETTPLVGTTAYVSPEQVLGRPAGPASDLYGLGCTLYELLVGRPPFIGAEPAQVVRRHLAHDPTPPSRLRADVPASLDRLILLLLTKNAASRPADAAEVARTLESIIADHRPPGARPAFSAAWTRSRQAERPPATARLPDLPDLPDPPDLSDPPELSDPPGPPGPPPDAGGRRRGSRTAVLVVAPAAAAAAVIAAGAVGWNSLDPRVRTPAVAPAPSGPAAPAPATSRPSRTPPPGDAAVVRVRLRAQKKDGGKDRRPAEHAKDAHKRRGGGKDH